MRKKLNSKDFFLEQYEVSIDYQKPDGYWARNQKEDVFVSVKHGENEKNNHSKAQKYIKDKFPNCRINYVIFC